MYYKIIKSFESNPDMSFEQYKEWIGYSHLKEFESVDSMFRKDLFEPHSIEDWENCVNDDFKLNLITNLEYAKKVQSKFQDGEIIGVEIELGEDYKPKPGLIGYDVLDDMCDVSLIANCKYEEDLFEKYEIASNCLIPTIEKAIEIRNIYRKDKDDTHASNCEVWAIYKIKNT